MTEQEPPPVPRRVIATLFVTWTTTFAVLTDTLRRYQAEIIQAPVGKDCDPVSSPKGMPTRIAFQASGWQRYCTERGLDRPMASVLNR